jgi:hypothetical protein
MNDADNRPAVVGQVEPSVMQHTRDGPWVDAGLTRPNPRISGGPLRLVKCEGVVIAFMPAWLDDEPEEARANARLVAAAPDLLAALQALRLAQEQNKYPSWEKGVPEFNKAEAMADAAIAKAVGSAA